MGEQMSTQVPARQNPLVDETQTGADAPGALVAEVAFKWLMAGQGWWVDTTRLHGDPSYAARFLRLALESPSFALRDCAASLQSQLGGRASGDAALGN